jgi:putative membrane protein
MRLRLLITHYVNGLLMGGADVVPGVSGGTVALIVGIYARLIESISRAVAAVPLLLRGRPVDAARTVLSVEWTLVLPLGAGIISAIVVASAVIPGLIEAHPVVMRGLFFGLIAGSITLPWRRLEDRSRRNLAVAVTAAIVAFVFAGLPDATIEDPSRIAVFAAAAIAICAMILPGVSGAFLLLVMGMYEPTLDAVHTRDLAYIATFAAGAAVGISFFASLLRWLLVRARDITMAALVGLMVGSLRALWPFLEDDRSLRAPIEGDPVVAAVVAAVAGLVVVLALATLGDRGEVATRGRAA